MTICCPHILSEVILQKKEDGMTFRLINRIKRARRVAADNNKEYVVSVTLTEEIDTEALNTARLRTGIGAGRSLYANLNTIIILDRADGHDAEEGMTDLLTIAGEYIRIRTGIVPEYNKWVRQPGTTGRTTGLILQRAWKDIQQPKRPVQQGTSIGISLVDTFNEAGKRCKTVTTLLSEAMEDAAWRTYECETAMKLSNLGGVALPKSMVKFVERLDYRTSDPGGCSCVSCGGKIYASCNTLSADDAFAQNFVEELAYLGIKAYICFRTNQLNSNESKTYPGSGISDIVLHMPWREGIQIRQRHILQGA